MVQAYHPRDRLTLAHDEWVRRYLEGRKWRGYLLTFMFNHLGGNHAAVLAQMQQEIIPDPADRLSKADRPPPCAVIAVALINRIPYEGRWS